jgi:hypothetical protein
MRKVNASGWIFDIINEGKADYDPEGKNMQYLTILNP